MTTQHQLAPDGGSYEVTDAGLVQREPTTARRTKSEAARDATPAPPAVAHQDEQTDRNRRTTRAKE